MDSSNIHNYRSTINKIHKYLLSGMYPIYCLKLYTFLLLVTLSFVVSFCRLVSGMKNAVVVDRFYDKSNWCIILRRT